MAGSSGEQQKRKPGPGRPFEKGRSGNPDGISKEARAIRSSVKEALDKAFTVEGRDLLVEAISKGVTDGDSCCMKLACEYRWGKPVQAVEHSGEGGGPLGVVVRFEDDGTKDDE